MGFGPSLSGEACLRTVRDAVGHCLRVSADNWIAHPVVAKSLLGKEFLHPLGWAHILHWMSSPAPSGFANES